MKNFFPPKTDRGFSTAGGRELGLEARPPARFTLRSRTKKHITVNKENMSHRVTPLLAQRIPLPGNSYFWRTAGRLPVLALLCLALGCDAADWPQFRGANHDGISTDRITTQWNGSVTNRLWLLPVTNCLGSLAVSGGCIFTQTRRAIGGASKEVCVALSITNGAELWAATVDDANYPNGGVGFDDGPRTTPAVDGGSVLVLSSYLKLYRLNATNGAVVWQQDLRTVYGGDVISFQNAASPVVEGGLIFLNRVHKPFVREDQSIDEHPLLVALGYTHATGINAFEWSVISVFGHCNFQIIVGSRFA